MADPLRCPPLTRDSVIAAHELVKPHIHYTPVLTNTTINNLASTARTKEQLVGTPWEGQEPAKPVLRLWFKCENFQRVGAFKVRGAFHALLRLRAEIGEEELKKKGVVTHSSGNHAQALSLAARTLAIPATIVMPTISTPSKIAATKGYGSTVIFSGSTSVEREAVVAEVVSKMGAILVPPYDHPDIILGQGTLGLELQEQVERMIEGGGQEDQNSEVPKCSFTLPKEGNGGKRKGLDAIIAPCGGGGMLSGTALSCEGTGIRVFAAEPSFEGADDLRRGLASGSRIETVKTLTIADGLRTPVCIYPWRIIHDRKLVAAAYSVGEEQIKEAMRLVYERMKMVVEPSAVVGLAVALFDEGFRKLVEREGGETGWDLGVVVSGGNVSLEGLGALFPPAEKKEKEREEGMLGRDGKADAEGVAG